MSSTNRIDIIVTESGSRTVVRNLRDIDDAAGKASNGLDLLKNALTAVLAVVAVDKVRQYADAWASATGIIAIATKTTEEATAVTQKLFEASQRTRVGFTEMVELYARAQRAGGSLGASQADLIKFSEGVGKALAVQHTSTTQAAGALLQLGQALGGAKIQAQEFNSLVDGAPVILQTVAKGMGVLDGNIGQLTRDVKSGKVSAKEFFDAFQEGQKFLDEDFAKSSLTIGQGITIIENAFTRFIGELDHSAGASRTFGEAAKFIADNMKQIGTILIAIAAASAVAFSLSYIIPFTNAVKALFILINTNPFVALASAIAAAAVYLSQFGDEMNAGIDDITSVNDVLRAFGEELKGAFVVAGEAAFDFFDSLGTTSTQTLNGISAETNGATTDWANSYSDFFSGLRSGFAGTLQGAAKVVDAIGGLLIGVGHSIVNVFSGLPDVFASIFGQVYNAVVGKIEDMINASIDGINRLRKLVGTELIDRVQFERKAVDDDAWKKYGQKIAGGIDQGFQDQGGFLEQWVNGVFDRSQQIAKDRVSKQKPPGQEVDLTKALGSGSPIKDDDSKASAKAARELNKLQNELRGLLNTVQPASGAVLELKKAQDVLTQSVAKHLITQQQADQYMVLVKQHYQDIIDPMAKVNRELDQQIKLLQLSSQQRQIESQFLQIQQDLQRQGQSLTADEAASLRAKLQSMQDLSRVTDAQDAILAQSVDKRKAFQTQLEAIQNLMNDSSSGLTSADAFQSITSSMGNADLFAGSQEAIDAQLAAYQQMYAQIDQLRNANIISEQTANAARLKVWNQTQTQQLSSTNQFLGALSALQKSNNSKQAAVGRAAAIAQATINTYTAATGAYSAMASIPYVGPFLGAAAAAAAVISGLSQVAQIRAQPTNFAFGGGVQVKGTGGTDSQNVAFRATPGETVRITTPAQERARERERQQGGAGGGGAAPPPTIVNLLHPELLNDYLQTQDGQNAIINVLQSNPRATERALSR